MIEEVPKVKKEEDQGVGTERSTENIVGEDQVATTEALPSGIVNVDQRPAIIKKNIQLQ